MFTLSRIRTIYPQPGVGTIRYPATPALDSSFDTWPSGYARITDERLPGDGYNLDILKVKSRFGGLINGSGSKPTDRQFANYQLALIRSVNPSIGVFTTGFNPVIPSDAEIATKFAAKTNPSRADIDLPVFLAELKDVPELIFKAGPNVFRNVAQANLAYTFGWAPLLSDLRAMLDFVSLTEKRLQELRTLKKGGLRRKRVIGTYSSVTTDNWPWDSAVNMAIPGKVTVVRNCKVWAYCKWKPTSALPSTDSELLALARRAVYGMTIDATTMWELIPFSWLVDYFYTIGSYCEATRNIVPCALSGPVQIMKHYQYQVFAPFADWYYANKGYSLDPFFESGERKVRSSATPTPYAARLPFLTGRQWSIIASLAVLRSGGYNGSSRRK